jgi:hypothetical protein
LDTGALHPRYKELQDKYGADLLPMGKITGGSDIASNLLNVIFRNLSFGSGGSLEPLHKKIPSTLSISRSVAFLLFAWLFFFTYALLAVVYVSHVDDRFFNTPRL